MSHGILSGNSIQLVNESQIEEFVMTNTNDVDRFRECKKIRVINIATFLATAIQRVHFGLSVSELFETSFDLKVTSFAKGKYFFLKKMIILKNVSLVNST